MNRSNKSKLHSRKINSRLKSGNAYDHLVQGLMSSSLLSKYRKIKIYRTRILLFLDGCETWSLTLRKEHMLKVFENRVLKMLFGPTTSGVRRGMEKTP